MLYYLRFKFSDIVFLQDFFLSVFSSVHFLVFCFSHNVDTEDTDDGKTNVQVGWRLLSVLYQSKGNIGFKQNDCIFLTAAFAKLNEDLSELY